MIRVRDLERFETPNIVVNLRQRLLMMLARCRPGHPEE
jgi:hypothetical protein